MIHFQMACPVAIVIHVITDSRDSGSWGKTIPFPILNKLPDFSIALLTITLAAGNRVERKINRRLSLLQGVRPIYYCVSIMLALMNLSVAHADDAINAEVVGQKNLSDWLLPEPSFPAHNPYSKSKAKLGKVLFFDPRLSHSKTTSCLSCHNPGLAWADGMERSELAGLHAMPRHTPSLINIAYRQNFFWDGRSASLEHALSEHLQAIYPDTRELIEEVVELPFHRSLWQ